MKKNYLLSAAAAFLLAVTGCSDDIENGGNSGGEDDGNHAYMNVRISTVADGPMTKADPSSPNGDGSGWATAGWVSFRARMRAWCIMLIFSCLKQTQTHCPKLITWIFLMAKRILPLPDMVIMM